MQGERKKEKKIRGDPISPPLAYLSLAEGETRERKLAERDPFLVGEM